VPGPEPSPRAPAAVDREDVIERAQRGDHSALPALKGILDAGHYALAEGVAELAQNAVLGRLAGKDLVCRELLRRDLDRLAAELAGERPTPLERLLAERAALCWLDATTLDVLHASTAGLSLAQAEHAGRARDRAHRRFLAAAKALAQVRKLGLPAVQINIGRNQLNVAGGGGPDT